MMVEVSTNLIESYQQALFTPFAVKNENDQCMTHHGFHGKCAPITFCPVLQNGLNLRSNHPTICSWNRYVPIVCCPILNTEVDKHDLSMVDGFVPSTSKTKPETVEKSQKVVLVAIPVMEGVKVGKLLGMPRMSTSILLPQNVVSSRKKLMELHNGQIMTESFIPIGVDGLSEKGMGWNPHISIVFHQNFDTTNPRSSVITKDIKKSQPELTDIKETSKTKVDTLALTTMQTIKEPTIEPKKMECGTKISPLYEHPILGGSDVTTDNEWPWMAAIFSAPQITRRSEKAKKMKTHFCGATIISESFVLTSAHCIDSFNGTKIDDIFVGVGSRFLEYTRKYEIQKIIKHPKYVSSRQYFDIALLITTDPIDFTDEVRPICLPEPSLNNLNVKNVYETAGWRMQPLDGLEAHRLMETSVDILPNQECIQSLISLKSSTMPEGIRSDQLCAVMPDEKKNSCFGDSGSPLIMKDNSTKSYSQVGIMSIGYHCDEKGSPGIYTKVSDYVPWIQEQSA